jgi:hypothetical protein
MTISLAKHRLCIVDNVIHHRLGHTTESDTQFYS